MWLFKRAFDSIRAQSSSPSCVNLPNEIEFEIIQYFGIRDLLQCRLVCKLWRNTLDDSIIGNNIWFYQYRRLCEGPSLDQNEEFHRVLESEFESKKTETNYWRLKCLDYVGMRKLEPIFKDDKLHSDEVWNCTFSNSGRRLATCGQDGNTILWKINRVVCKNGDYENYDKGYTVTKSRIFYSSFRNYSAVTFSRDDKHLIASDYYHKTCLVLELSDEEDSSSSEEDEEKPKKKKKKDERVVPHREKNSKWPEVTRIMSTYTRSSFGDAEFIDKDLMLDISCFECEMENRMRQKFVELVYIVRKVKTLKVHAIMKFHIPPKWTPVQQLKFFSGGDKNEHFAICKFSRNPQMKTLHVSNEIVRFGRDVYSTIFRKKPGRGKERRIVTVEMAGVSRSTSCVELPGHICDFTVTPNGRNLCVNVNMRTPYDPTNFFSSHGEYFSDPYVECEPASPQSEGEIDTTTKTKLWILGDEMCMFIIDSKSLAIKRRMTGPHYGEPYAHFRVGCSDRFVTSGCMKRGLFFIWDILTGVLVCKLGEEVTSMRCATKIHPDGKLVCSVSDSGFIEVYFPKMKEM